ncbi:hypothetical protein BH23THE1_BH23THE1_26200 [soil metagenome]
MTIINKISFERSYRMVKDVKVKERMLLVLNVVYQGRIAAHVAKDLHRSRSWVCQWIKRYDRECTPPNWTTCQEIVCYYSSNYYLHLP